MSDQPEIYVIESKISNSDPAIWIPVGSIHNAPIGLLDVRNGIQFARTFSHLPGVLDKYCLMFKRMTGVEYRVAIYKRRDRT